MRKSNKANNKKVLCVVIVVVLAIILAILLLIALSKKNRFFANNYDKYKEKSNNSEVVTDIFNEEEKIKQPSRVIANVPMFMYHFILEDYGDNWDYENFVRPSTLEEQIKYMVDNGYDPIFVSEIDKLAAYDKPVCLTFDDCFVYFYDNAFPILKKYNFKVTIFVITDYINGENYLTPEQIKEMSDSGLVDVQSHTAAHLDLNTLNDEELEHALKDSKNTLEEITGKTLNTICYPYGRYNNYVLEKCKELYKYGVAMDGGMTRYNSDNYDLFQITRIYANRTMPMYEFQNYLKQSYVNVEW